MGQLGRRQQGKHEPADRGCFGHERLRQIPTSRTGDDGRNALSGTGHDRRHQTNNAGRGLVLHLQALVQVPTASVCHSRVTESARRRNRARSRQASRLKWRAAGPLSSRQANHARRPAAWRMCMPSRSGAAARQAGGKGPDGTAWGGGDGDALRVSPRSSAPDVRLECNAARRGRDERAPDRGRGRRGAAHRRGTRSMATRSTSARFPGCVAPDLSYWMGAAAPGRRGAGVIGCDSGRGAAGLR